MIIVMQSKYSSTLHPPSPTIPALLSKPHFIVRWDSKWSGRNSVACLRFNCSSSNPQLQDTGTNCRGLWHCGGVNKCHYKMSPSSILVSTNHYMFFFTKKQSLSNRNQPTDRNGYWLFFVHHSVHQLFLSVEFPVTSSENHWTRQPEVLVMSVLTCSGDYDMIHPLQCSSKSCVPTNFV